MPKVNKFLSALVLATAICFSGNVYAADSKMDESEMVTQQKRKVTGTITDDFGPVIGASISVKGTTIGTVSDFDGNFSIEVSDRQTLVISFIGYIPQEIAINGQTNLNIHLKEDSQALGEVVVTALGIKRDAKKLGYAISTISSDELVKTSAPTLGSALYGKAAGVRIQTAPGGMAGSISINVRGLSSMTGTNQPLVVVDGVPIHNGDANLDGYWSNQRIQSNGLSDINPEDIATLSILKGAAASALYGSEAANGVVVITTKTGEGATGFGVDFNASVTVDPVAYMPRYQTTYGPGYPEYLRTTGRNLDADGWLTTGWTDRHGNVHRRGSSTTMYWGPRYDGQDVLYYDGTVRKYNAITDNPWADVFRTGITQQYNLAITNATEKGNMRFSYTYVDNMPTQYNSSHTKHDFKVSGTFNVTKTIKLNYGVAYTLQNMKNPPYKISRLTNNFGGMFGAFDDIDYLRRSTKTSLGYKNQVYTANTHLTPDEGYEWTPATYALVDEYFWNIYGKEQLEDKQRLIAHVNPSWQIIDGLVLSGRVATDYTATKTEDKNQTEQSTVFDTNRGYYGTANNTYTIISGDAMLNYSRDLTDNIGLSAMIGWTGRQEKAHNVSVGTQQGLSVENWFHLNASNGPKSADMKHSELLRTAYYGVLGLSYGNWAFLDGTFRQEKVSTFARDNNTFSTPSVSASIIYTDLLKEKLPAWYNYGKVRASYGIVGNDPGIYRATQAYTQNTVGGQWIYNAVDQAVGNNNIRPEKKYEWEFGWENKFLDNRLGFEASYYTSRTEDQILKTTMPASAGGTSIMMNIGELKNKGFEFSIYGTPIQTRDFKWDLRANMSWNKNKVSKLADGIDRIEHENVDNGSAYIYSVLGESMGDIYTLAPLKNENGDYIVKENGYYQLSSEPVKVGNAMADVVGGFSTTFTYKNFVLDALFDFKIGGDVINVPYQYMIGQGAIKESLKYHDGEGNGLTYYMDAGMNVVPHNGTTGPNGERIYDNGMILPGVTADGEPNNKMISAAQWAYWTYNWGGYDPTSETYYEVGVFDNSYIKCRELSFGYNLPQSILSKIKCKSLMVSVYGRNLFYVYKNLPIFDAEAAESTNWHKQAIIGGSTTTTRSFGLSLRASF